ncbi:MAG: aminotransferase class I/II-fold pyridoxal phosphate-dependent enzyme [Planctomycetota bacterium]|jgi:aspartate aminotransferase
MDDRAPTVSDAAATAAAGIRLSDRVRRMRPSSTLALSARVKQLKAEGRDVIGFAAGEPDFDTPAPLVEVAIEALRSGRTRYEPVPGPPATRRAVAERLAARHGMSCAAEDVLITVGGKSAIFFALLAVIEPGVRDEVVVPTPAWVSYRPMIELAGGRMVEVPRTADDGFRLHPDAIAEAIGPRTCGLLLMSKAFAMTGWRLGWAISSAPGVAAAMAAVQGQVTSHATAFCYPAIDAAMAGVADADLAAMRETFAARGRLMHAMLSAIEGVRCPEPTGAFYCFPDVSWAFGRRTPAGREIADAAGFAEALLEEAEVAVMPGEEFGAGGERHVRLSFACGEPEIREGVERLGRFMASLDVAG